MTETPSGERAAADDVVIEEAPAPIAIGPADLGLDLPADEAEAQQVLLGAVLVARQESGEYLETMQRIAAEFDNYRKRADRDRIDLVQRAAQRLIMEMLPTLDSFDAALAYDPQTESEDRILDGMKSTRTQLLELLRAEGLEAIESVGVVFDPAVHEAVSGPTAAGEGDLVVANELRRGYTLSGRVLRAALVTVEHSEGAGE
ncbi:MAG: nucleotide exchange factor GrpE [bacterium]|nr:nucleotide exchange factor GrpE [bacterium]